MVATWYHPDGRPASPEEAQNLLVDVSARLLAEDTLHIGAEVVVVSTWFTVFDHAPTPGTLPLLWETVVSDGLTCTDLAHYSTREQAVQGHADTVTLIRSRLRELSAEEPAPLADPVPSTEPAGT
jgi:hypothetical protein